MLNWNRFCLRLWVWLSGEKDRTVSLITQNWKEATLNTTDEFVSQPIMKLGGNQVREAVSSVMAKG